jgi:opacity protein-like surface antigen
MITTHGSLAALAALALLAALSASPAHADDPYFSPTDERVRISLGAMHVSSSTNVRADSSTGVAGTTINGEREFGLDASDFEPKFQATVRVAKRQRLSFDYFTLDRSGNTTVAGTPIAFRDVTLLPGDPLQTKLSLRSLGITYGYSFWHSETLEIAATLGVHATDVSAEARVQTPTRHIIQTEDQAGPIPTLGIDATWVVSKRFYLDGRAQYLKVNISNLDGALGIYELDVLYRYRPNVSFAVGYSDLTANITSTKASKSGVFDFTSKGPEMFFRIAF